MKAKQTLMPLHTNLWPYLPTSDAHRWLFPHSKLLLLFIFIYFISSKCAVKEVGEMWEKDKFRKASVHKGHVPSGVELHSILWRSHTSNACSSFLWQSHVLLDFNFFEFAVLFPDSVATEGGIVIRVCWVFLVCFVCFLSQLFSTTCKFECLDSSVFLRLLLEINSHITITKPMQFLWDT